MSCYSADAVAIDESSNMKIGEIQSLVMVGALLNRTWEIY